MTRAPGMSVRLKLTLSYAGFLMVAGVLLLAVVWVFLLRYVPDGPLTGPGPFIPNRGDLIRAFTPAAGWALLFLLLTGLLGGWILAGRMLAPLARLTEATRLAAGGSLSHRIELDGRQDEFRELADSFDAMLARLEAHVEEQRRFAANASHELRTPLAITQALLDVARNDRDRDIDELLERLRAVNSRAIELTEAMLVLSRAEQGTFAREPVDLSLVAEQAAETLLPLAEARGITIDSTGEVALTSGSYALLLQLVSNLLHNAIVHNLPAHGSVELRVRRGGEDAEVVVRNSGEVISPVQASRLTEPFHRGSERVRTGDHAGTGLGLAIARSIAEAHGGTLTLAAQARGGLCVTVRLPGEPR